MAKKSSSLLVGSSVLFDYPTFTHADNIVEHAREHALAEYSKKHDWMKTGVIVNISTVEGALEIDVRMDVSGQIVATNRHAISITKLPPPDRTEELLEEVVSELHVITEYIRNR